MDHRRLKPTFPRKSKLFWLKRAWFGNRPKTSFGVMIPKAKEQEKYAIRSF
jgi:hypothetical protein